MKIVEGGSKPYWNKTFSFKIDRGMDDLQIRIYSKNTLRDDDLLGESLWVTLLNSLPFEIVCMFLPTHGSHSQSWFCNLFHQIWRRIKNAIGKDRASLGDCDMLSALNYTHCWLNIVRKIHELWFSLCEPHVARCSVNDTGYFDLPGMSVLTWWSPCFGRISFAQVFRDGHEVPVTSYKVNRSGKHYGEVRLGLTFYAKRVGYTCMANFNLYEFYNIMLDDWLRLNSHCCAIVLHVRTMWRFVCTRPWFLGIR